MIAILKPILTFRILPSAVKLTLPNSTTVTIPANQLVLLSTYAMGRDPKNFESPNLFWPGRWERRGDTDVTTQGNDVAGRRKSLVGVSEPFAWMPFGFGPRACVGRVMAMQQMTYFAR